MEGPDGGVFEGLGLFGVAPTTKRDDGGEDAGVKGGEVPGAGAAHGGAGEVEAGFVDGQFVGEIGDERHEVGGDFVFPADVTAWALRGEDEAGAFGLVFGAAEGLGGTAHLRFVVVAALAGAVEPDDEGVALVALPFRVAIELVVQALSRHGFDESSGDFVGVRSVFEASVTGLLAQEAAHVGLIGGGEFVQRQLEDLKVGGALDFDFVGGELDELAFESGLAVGGGPGAFFGGGEGGEQQERGCEEGQSAGEGVHGR